MIAANLARTALRYGAIAFTILPFLLNLRRAGERAGRLSERLETRERNDAIHRQMLEAASRRPADRRALAERFARVGSEAAAACPPVVEYSAEEQAGAAAEVGELAEGAMVVRMLGDYAVLRDQARACE